MDRKEATEITEACKKEIVLQINELRRSCMLQPGPLVDEVLIRLNRIEGLLNSIL